jgi:hypothetical protein
MTQPDLHQWLRWLAACWTLPGACIPQEVYRWIEITQAQRTFLGDAVLNLITDAAEVHELNLTLERIP